MEGAEFAQSCFSPKNADQNVLIYQDCWKNVSRTDTDSSKCLDVYTSSLSTMNRPNLTYKKDSVSIFLDHTSYIVNLL